MPSETPNLGAKFGNMGTVHAKMKAKSSKELAGSTESPELPDESPVAKCLMPDPLVDLIIERIVRILYQKNPELKRKHPALRARTGFEKRGHFNKWEAVDLLIELTKECDRAARLLLEIRVERERLLASGPKSPATFAPIDTT